MKTVKALKMQKFYPQSKVEINGFMAKYYDTLLNIATFGRYYPFIEKAIELMKVNPEDRILDLGAGTGRNACLMMKYLSPKGQLIGIDISDEMISQFKKKCGKFPNAKIVKTRIDQPLSFREEFDKVFISFVLHGFPQNIRKLIIGNVSKVLKDNADFFILDYNEFSYVKMPFYLKIPFRFMECPYAFDFVERDWKRILTKKRFKNFEEHFFFRSYVRLLKATKIEINET